jgi:hypothetical protein
VRRAGRGGEHSPHSRAPAVRPGRVGVPSLTRLALRVPDPGLDDADTVVPDSDGRTCGFIAGYASVITPDDPICAEIEPAEWVCCPAAAAATGATAAVITTTAATVAAPATTTATVAATTGVPEGFDVTDQNSG